MIFGDELLYVWCATHILNLIVGNRLKDLHESVERVSSAMRFVRFSLSRLRKFKFVVRVTYIICKKDFCLDVSIRWNSTWWNSTFLMLEMTQEYRATFKSMKEDNLPYVTHFNDDHDGGWGLGMPLDHDWEIVGIFVDFFRLFYKITTIFSNSLYVTSNIFCHHIYEIKKQLDKMCNSKRTIILGYDEYHQST